MRIAIDLQIFTLQTYGGISRYFTQLTQAIETLVYSDGHVEALKALGVNRLTNFSWSKCA